MNIKAKVIDIWNQSKDFLKLLFRRLRLVRLNRNFLVFLVFLAISMCFWWLKTLRETTSYTQEFTVKIANLPDNVIITSGMPNKIRVALTSSGMSLVDYKMKNRSYVITLNYNDMDKSRSSLTMDNITLRRVISKELISSLKISSVYPSQIEMSYTKGKPKRTPIIFKGMVKADKQHVLSGIELKTEVAEVFAPEGMYNNITCVYTEPLNLENVEDNMMVRVPIAKLNNAKIIPDSVDVKIKVDVFVEKSMQVPILCSNIPRNKVLRFFPSKADIKFNISLSNYEKISESDFIISVDYDKISKNDKFGTLELSYAPDYVSNVRFKPEKVEFIVETIDEQ